MTTKTFLTLSLLFWVVGATAQDKLQNADSEHELDQEYIKQQQTTTSGSATFQVAEKNAEKTRRHVISVEGSNVYVFSPSVVGLNFPALNYDFHFSHGEKIVIGGTVSLGLLTVQTGAFLGVRLLRGDMIKTELGMAVVANVGEGHVGPYGEITYRSQRDSRWFFWEVGGGLVVNTFSPDPPTNNLLPYAKLGAGISF